MQVVMAKTNKLTTVPDGYARNYLLPRGLAKPATLAAVAQAKTNSAQAAADTLAQQQADVGLISQLKQTHLTIKAKASAQGKLFAAITPAIVIAALHQRQLSVDSSMLQLPVVKQLGDYQMVISVPGHPPVSLPLTVESA